MKGIVNRGLQELVEARFGTETWETVCHNAGCTEPSFSPSLNYPDQLTLDLVRATSEHTGLTPDEVMIEYGKFWVPNTGKRSYPSLFALAGDNPRDFLRRMDRIHAQVTLSLPGARPPRLEVEEAPDGTLVMRYASPRRLCPVLRGLVLGVGANFGVELAVHERQCACDGHDACIFEIRLP